MKKERFEWIRSWCDFTDKDDLPRALLVGDSITDGYQSAVRELLLGVAYVDYLANTYAVDKKIYRTLLKTFVADSKYDVIHFNNGLHGRYISGENYEKGIKKALSFFGDAKIILTTTTFVFKKGNKIPDPIWGRKVTERNAIIKKIANENGYFIDDLYPVSVNMDKSFRYIDGTHYLEEGNKILAKSVSESIKHQLEKIKGV